MRTAPESCTAELSRVVLSEHDLETTSTRVVELVRDRLGADLGGLTIIQKGTPQTVAMTDPLTLKIDQGQYDGGDGPCIEAVRTREPVRVDDMSGDSRWSQFAELARAQGVMSALSLPIVAHDLALGAFNLYSFKVGQFALEPTCEVSTFADQAAVVLVNAREFWEARHKAEQLNMAMQSRSTIEQAVGILMAPGGRTAEQAFQMLVRASQRENRKLREIAADIVQRTTERRPPN